MTGARACAEENCCGGGPTESAVKVALETIGVLSTQAACRTNLGFCARTPDDSMRT